MSHGWQQRLQTGISVVVPVYRSTETIPHLVERINSVIGDSSHEIIMVDDGSPEETWSCLRRVATNCPNVKAVRLGRNYGQHSALLAGVRMATFATIVTLDDDLQNPPEEIPKLLAALKDDVDVVYGSPAMASQDLWRRLGSAVTRRVISSALGASTAKKASSFRAFKTQLRDGFAGEFGPGVSIDALLSWSTVKFADVSVSHNKREDGSSTYTLRKLWRHAVDTATGYSTVPLQMATSVGFATAFFGVGVLGWVIGRRILLGTSVAGFPFLASIITIFAGVQLVTLGFIGEYLARMHFRVMRKPAYVVAEVTEDIEG